MEYLFKASRVAFSHSIDLHFAANAGGELAVAQPLVFEKADRNEVLPDTAALRLTQEDAQALMDELWHVGLRPSEGTGSAGSLAATERHLEDMRKIVFEGGK